MVPWYLIVTVTLVGPVASAGAQASSNDVPEVPTEARETTMALSAAPEHLRSGAGVYVLTASGYKQTRQSTNKFTCIVNRDHPKALKPTCFDEEGTATILPTILRVGELMMQRKSLSAIAEDVRAGFASGRYVSPRRPGIAYMLSGDIRNVNPATGAVSSFPPHVMFYAPNLTNEDIGSNGVMGLPFIAYQGPHGYMIMPVAQNAGSHGAR
jgi:hypothetical protein